MARRNFKIKVVSRLIEEVKSRPYLWDMEHKDYNDRYKMTAAWYEISKVLDMPVDTLRVKWKSLRDFFIRTLRTEEITNPEDYTGAWRHFRSMWFIYRPVRRRRRTDSDDEDTTNDRSGIVVKCEPVDPEETDVFQEDKEGDTNDKRPRESSEEDFDEMFLKSLTPFLKKLEPTRKLIARNKIQNILLDEIAAQTAGTDGSL